MTASAPQEAVRRRFAAAALPVPPLPDALAGDLRAVGDFVFSTRPDGPSPYAVDWYLDELLGECHPGDYLVLGHDGHGFNSWALHYLLVRSGLAVFDQIAWGGAYTDDAAAVSAMEVHWAQITDLLEATATARASGALFGDEWIVVLASDFHGSRWYRGLLSPTPEWRRSGSPTVTLVEAAIEAQSLAAT